MADETTGKTTIEDAIHLGKGYAGVVSREGDLFKPGADIVAYATIQAQLFRDLNPVFGPLRELGQGDDAVVFLKPDLVNNRPTVVKAYCYLQTKLSPSDTEKVLKIYAQDTQNVIGFLETNPYDFQGSVQIDGINYSPSFIVLPQGSVGIRSSKLVYTDGQEYILGTNLLDARDKRRGLMTEVTTGEPAQYGLSEAEYMRFGLVLDGLIRYINNKNDTNFLITEANVIPQINRGERKIYLYVTDLANNLYDEYIRSKPDR